MTPEPKRLLAGFLVGLALSGPAAAEWQQVTCVRVAPATDTAEVRLPFSNDRFDAFRLIGASGKAKVDRVKVRFHNDETEGYGLDKTLAAGERTRRLALPDAPRRLKSFDFSFENPRDAGTQICVEALAAKTAGGGSGGNSGGGSGGGGWSGGDGKIEAICRKEAAEMGFDIRSVGKVREVQKAPPIKEARMELRSRGRDQIVICRYDERAELASFYNGERPSDEEIAALRHCREGAMRLDYRVISMGDVREVDVARAAREVRLKVRIRGDERRLICRYHGREELATFYSPR